MLARLRMLVPAVAIAALAGAPLALMTLGDDSVRRDGASAGTVVTAGGKRFVRPQASPEKHAHSGDLGVPGMSESDLRTFETEVLGPAHAREHARMRRALRSREGSAGTPERSPRVASAAGKQSAGEASTGDERGAGDGGAGDEASAAGGPSAAGEPATQAAAAAGDPADVGRWSAPFSIPVMAVHAAMLPTGKVMWFSYPKNPNTRHGGDGPSSPNTAQAWLWDPATGQHKRVDPPLWRDPADGQLKPANIWCAGQAFTADGRLVVAGGNLAFSSDSSDFKGLNKVYTFNPFNETWTEQPDMRHGRWYPSQVLLPDGRMPILSGLDESGVYPGNFNSEVEVFTPSPDMNGRGTISYVGSRGGSGQPPRGGNYPHLFAMPSGRTLVAGPFPGDSWFMNTPSASSFTWQDAPNLPTDRLWGTAVLMPGGPGGSTRVMGLGGSKPPTITSTTTDIAVPTTEVFDETNPGLGWRPAPSMKVGRGHHNTVLLPDGSMASVGGGVGIRNGDQWAADEAQKQIELWDPATGQWRLGPAQAENRAYHSIAMLLPDGRVISAGDDVHGGIDRDTAEIYEPPYLFKGPRPTIGSAPATVRTGTSFDVDTPNTNIAKATLIAPSATTHAVDMNQRSLSLTVTQRAGGVRLTAPATPEIASPGYYMLFLVDDQGVPSVAKFVKLETSQSPSSEDKAAGRPTSASSVEKAGVESAKAVDGNSTTRWSSGFQDNQWWQVDLGSARKVNKVELNWEAAYASRYKILTSTDGTSFSEAADVTASGPGLKATTFAERDARYVRVQGVTRATQYGISFWDARVFGPDDTAPPPPPPPPPPSSDLAQGKPASASSIEGAGLEATKAVDNNSATRWSSDFLDNQWWQVDLGSAQSIDRVELNWEDAYASRYKILTSTDGTSFSEAADVSIASPGLKTSTFPARSARYVRVQGVTRATQYGISLWDARVFAASGSPPPPPPPPPPPSSYADTILGTTGLTGYWRLNETSGSTAAAARGSVTGNYGSGALLGQPGLLTGDTDKAPLFQASSSSWVRFGDVFDFPGNRAFSIELWIKPTTVDGTGRRILSKEWSNAAGTQGWYLVHTSSRLEFSRIRDGNWQNASRGPLTPGTRYHLALTYDGTTMRLYVNGALAGSGASPQALLDGGAAFAIGARPTGGSPFLGTIDEPAVYDGAALSAGQVQAHYDAGK